MAMSETTHGKVNGAKGYLNRDKELTRRVRDYTQKNQGDKND